jgi:glutathione S-transferase
VTATPGPASPPARGHRLITIPISHYCEKARWALDRAGIAYAESAHLQVFHWVAVRRAGGGRTAPVLVCPDGRVLGESADIVRYASDRGPAESRLYPVDPAMAAEIAALERDYDDHLGPDGRAWMYDALRGHPGVAVAYATTGIPAWQRRIFPRIYPVAMRIIDRYLDITPAGVAASKGRVHATFDAVAERLADGRLYLCGERFTAADLTFAALAAPMLMPEGYGVPLPRPAELPDAMRTEVEACREHPAGLHALRMFREERGRAARDV